MATVIILELTCSGHMPQQTYQHEMMYPQTQQMTYDPLPEFYTHDQALPFSPSTGSFPQVHPQPGQEIYRGMREGVNDMVFSTFPEGIRRMEVHLGLCLLGGVDLRWVWEWEWVVMDSNWDLMNMI
jgi:hypothetical protein